MNAGRELDRLVAEKVMGLWIYCYDKPGFFGCYYKLMEKDSFRPICWDNERRAEADAWNDVPHYSTDIAAARLVEDRIEQLGLQEDYAIHLFLLVNPGSAALPLMHWHMLRATPEQRCRAALRAAFNDKAEANEHT